MRARRRLFGLVGLSALLLGLAIYQLASMARERRVTGSWRGELDRGTVTLTLQQSATGLVGSGVLAFRPVVVTGTYAAPHVSLNITTQRSPLNYTGTLDGGHILGYVNGDGYPNQPLTLVRQ